MFYKDVVLSQAGKIQRMLPEVLSLPLAFLREIFSQYAAYYSPRSLFFLPDADLQRSIPDLSVFYFWMVIPFVLGIYHLWKNKDKLYAKFIILLLAASPLPTVLVGDPFSTQRALPLLLPLMITIVMGVDVLLKKAGIYKWLIFSLTIFVSMVLLWRSYFVLLPNERAKIWGYGFEQLAGEVKNQPGMKFLIDQSRIKPAYIELAFFLNYSPERFQIEADKGTVKDYYFLTDFDLHYVFSNIETRNINWEKDAYQQQILVGDEHAISDTQQKEHFLEKVFEIRSPIDEIIFQGYKTNPDEKCKSSPVELHCRKL